MKNKILAGFLAVFTILNIINLPAYADNLNGDDKIFLLPSKNSAQSHDFILVQSNGKFGLIDAGTNQHSEARNQQDIYDFMDKIGVKTLDFVLITHFDEDHITALSKTLGDETQTIFDKYNVKEAIFKPLLDYSLVSSAPELTKNADYYAREKQAYDEALNTLNLKNISYGLKKSFSMGDFKFNIVNNYDLSDGEKANFWMNLEPLGVLVEKDDYKMFLGGDIEQADLDKTISDLKSLGVTTLDAFKMNHHGYSVSAGNDKTVLPVRGGFGSPIVGVTNNRNTLFNNSADSPQKLDLIEKTSPNGLYWQGDGIVKFDFSNLNGNGLTVSQVGNTLESYVKHINGAQQFGNRAIVAPIKDDFIVDKMTSRNSNASKAEVLPKSSPQKLQTN